MDASKVRAYLSNRGGGTAHLIRQFADGKVYFFCNHTIVEPNGKILTMEEADTILKTATYASWTYCGPCFKVIERAMEVIAVLSGGDPRDIAEGADNLAQRD